LLKSNLTRTSLPASPDLRSESPTVSFALGTALSAQAVKAPIFVPKFGSTAAAAAAASPPPPEPPTTLLESLAITTSCVPFLSLQSQSDRHRTSKPTLEEHTDEHEYDYEYDYDETANNPYLDYPDEYNDYHHPTFALAPIFTRQPLNYLLYTPSLPPDQTRVGPGHFYVGSEQVRRVLQERAEETRGGGWTGGADPTQPLPEEVGGYHSLVPLENPSGDQKRKFSNWASVVYRAVKMSDGRPYVLRRIESASMSSSSFLHMLMRIRFPASHSSFL